MAGVQTDSVKIAFPVECHYRGGNASLGRHGRHFWIKDGRVGHGELGPTHAVPITSVASIEVEERQVGGSEEKILVSPGLTPGILYGSGIRRASPPRQETDITVHTKDGRAALWVVERRGAEWVRARLTPLMVQQGIPYTEDLPSDQRSGLGRS
jgi:hypothetical protein